MGQRAEQNLANPSGLLLGAVLMLVHIGQPEIAERVHNAWLKTMEDGVHTYDIFREGVSKEKVGTKEFGEAVVARLGKKPETLNSASYAGRPVDEAPKPVALAPRQESELVGIDAYVEWPSGVPATLASEVVKANGDGLSLTMISNRGVKVWPDGFPETFCTDSFRCRFTADGAATHAQILSLLGRIVGLGFEIVKTEYLRTYGGVPGFSLAQGQ